MKITSSILIVLFSLNIAFAQEKVLWTAAPPGSSDNTLKTNVSVDTLELPFWDDFSETKVSPSPYRWEPSGVYINSRYTDKMPSVGIATFDAFTAQGKFPPAADYETPYTSDTLCSKPLNLYYPGNTSIFLSFYYRPQGYGDAPESHDELRLEFYAPETDTWEIVWSEAGKFDTDFEPVMIQISQAKYLKKGFRFRFTNIASLGSVTYDDLAGNCDFWHIDYVYLDKNRTPENFSYPDISLSLPVGSLLKNYTSVPWKHYAANPDIAMTETFEVALKNHEGINRSIDSLNFYKIRTETGEQSLLESGARNINAFGYLEPANLINLFEFEADDEEEAHFQIKAELVTDEYDPTSNNEYSYFQVFEDYYAYDDGSAEAAYGLYGNGTKYGMAAMRFESFKPDSLIGVEMYFSRTLNNASQNYFWLNFWHNDKGLPYDTVYAQIEGVLPQYSDTLNKFHFFDFEKPVYVEGSFFVGWTQTSDDMLNVGFDFNRKANQNLFYNISGEWKKSEIEGALMIRPVFMNADINPQAKNFNPNEILLSPNPADNFIRLTGVKSLEDAEIRIYNLHGELVLQGKANQKSEFNLSGLPSGVYIFTAKKEDGFYRTKFVKK